MKAALPPKVQKLVAVFLESPGHTAREVRSAVLGRSAELGGGEPAGEVPEGLRGYVEKVALQAYRITDDDIASLKAKGHSEDQIFEVTLAAALGAGVARM